MKVSMNLQLVRWKMPLKSRKVTQTHALNDIDEEIENSNDPFVLEGQNYKMKQNETHSECGNLRTKFHDITWYRWRS